MRFITYCAKATNSYTWHQVVYYRHEAFHILPNVIRFAVPTLCFSISAKIANKERVFNFSDPIVSKTSLMHPILYLLDLLSVHFWNFRNTQYENLRTHNTASLHLEPYIKNHGYEKTLCNFFLTNLMKELLVFPPK